MWIAGITPRPFAMVLAVSLGLASAAQAAPPTETEPKGAAVVAIGDDAGEASKPLVRALYQDPELLPAVDDTTAHVLLGEAPPAGATARQKELAELRASIGSAGSDAVERRLLASIGAELHAAVVVAVRVSGDKTSARVLRVAPATFTSTELVATVTRSDDGSPSYVWPGAAATVKSLLAPRGPRRAAATAPPEGGSFGGLLPKLPRSPWFWGGLSALVAASVTIFVVAKATGGSTAPGVHVTGSVPQ